MFLLWNLRKFLRTPFLKNICKWRLLILVTNSLFFTTHSIPSNVFELNALCHKCLIDILWKVDKILLGNIHTCFECRKTQNRKNFVFGHFFHLCQSIVFNKEILTQVFIVRKETPTQVCSSGLQNEIRKYIQQLVQKQALPFHQRSTGVL